MTKIAVIRLDRCVVCNREFERELAINTGWCERCREFRAKPIPRGGLTAAGKVGNQTQYIVVEEQLDS